MRHANRVNLFLGILLLTVAVIAWWLPGQQKAPPHSPRMTQETPEQIHTIVIKRRDQIVAELERKSSPNWNVRIGEQTLPASTWRVDNILRLLISDSFVQMAVPAAELSKFELDPAQISVKFDNVEIALGGLENVSGRRYALANGVVHLIEDKFYRQLALDPLEMVDLQLLPGRPNIKSVNFGDWRIAKDAQGAWRAQGVVMDVGADAATAFIEEWRYAQAIAVRRIDHAVRPIKHVTVTLEDENALRFDWAIDGNDAWLVRRDIGLMYQIPRDVLQRLTDFSPHLAAPR